MCVERKRRKEKGRKWVNTTAQANKRARSMPLCLATSWWQTVITWPMFLFSVSLLWDDVSASFSAVCPLRSTLRYKGGHVECVSSFCLYSVLLTAARIFSSKTKRPNHSAFCVCSLPRPHWSRRGFLNMTFSITLGEEDCLARREKRFNAALKAVFALLWLV